jgi:hypothetical protein
MTIIYMGFSMSFRLVLFTRGLVFPGMVTYRRGECIKKRVYEGEFDGGILYLYMKTD